MPPRPVSPPRESGLQGQRNETDEHSSFVSHHHEEHDATPFVEQGLRPLSIETARATVALPESAGSRAFELPLDEDALRVAVEDSLTTLSKAELLLRLEALIQIQGQDSSELSTAANFYFRQMLAELERFSGQQQARRAELLRQAVEASLNPLAVADFPRVAPGEPGYEAQVAASVHQNITAILEQSPSLSGRASAAVRKESLASTYSQLDEEAVRARQALGRQDSILAIGAKWTDSSSLLAHGVETYIKAIRKLLRHDAIGSQVHVALREYHYDVFPVADPAEKNRKEKTVVEISDTVGTRCRSFFVGIFGAAPMLVWFILRTLFNAARAPCRRGGAVESELEAPLVDDEESQGSGKHDPARLNVLKNISLLIKPGRFTLILGPPGSGRTSLLRAISGQLLKAPGKTEARGELLYNGRSAANLKLANWVAYAAQIDDHMPLLTVRETLTHAFKCRKEIRYTDPELTRLVRERFGEDTVERLAAFHAIDVDVALAVLGLSECADTVIGNETLKGISGGERRRVTLGEMMLTGTPVLCLDEISTGLDSAATFDISQYLRLAANFLEQTILVALLQPPPEVIDLFDDVIVMAEGQIIYHGERAAMLEYFEGLGFKCPPEKELGDFIQELPTPEGDKFCVPGANPPRTAREFAFKWRISSAFREQEAAIRAHLSEEATETRQREAVIDLNSVPENPWYRQFSLALQWSWRNRLKDTTKIKAKISQCMFMGTLFGTIFFQIPFDESYQKNMMLFNVVTFASQTALPEIQNTIRSRSIYHKHIDQGFYRAWMLNLANLITIIPLMFLDCMIFGNLVYFMCGLVPDVSAYGMYVTVSVLYGVTMNSVMSFFPYLFQDENRATIVASLMFMMSMLLGGIVATSGVLPFYFQPLFQINPLAWAFRALANIEYLTPSEAYDANPCTVNLNGRTVHVPMRCGDFFLESRQIAIGWDYVYGSLLVLSGYLVAFWLFGTLCLTYVRFEPPRGSKPRDSEAVEEASPIVSREGSPNQSVTAASLQHENLTLVVKGLGYDIPSKTPGVTQRLDLLSDITVWAKHGRLTALMGSSGAGKTTLLDVLAGLKTVGTTRGEIFLGGKRMSHSGFTRVAGYVQQFGVHSPMSTIREALEFSAGLRLPASTFDTPEAKQRHVDQCLELLELTRLQNQVCGACSMEQNKRLTLGVELVANPSVLLADEPTSGLDARAAGIVMRVLKRVAASGRIVIATIHQPSAQIFEQFDDLVLLKKGGRLVYFGEIGPRAENMIAYFEAVPGTPKFKVGTNPATWMLNVIGGGTGVRSGSNASKALAAKSSKATTASTETSATSEETEEDTVSGCRVGSCELRWRRRRPARAEAASLASSEIEEDGLLLDFAQIYARSDLKKHNDERLHSGEFGPIDAREPLAAREPARVYATSAPTQFRWLLRRTLAELWRTPDFAYTRFVVAAFYSLCFVSIFFQQGVENAPDAQSRIMGISFSTSLVSMFCMNTLMPYTMNQRAVFYREKGAGMYAAALFSHAAALAQVPYLVILSFLVVNVVYWGIGLTPMLYSYLYYMGISFLAFNLFCNLGMLFSAVMPEPVSAQLLAGVYFHISNLFAGITVPAGLIPKPYMGFHFISPLRWIYEGILSTQFYGDHRVICNPTGVPVEETEGALAGMCTRTGLPDPQAVTGVQVPLSAYVLGDFLEGYQYEHRYWDIGVLLAMIFVIRQVTTVATEKLVFDQR